MVSIVTLILCLISNDPELVREAQTAGIERMLIDLESLGKAERQKGEGLYLSPHRPSDVASIRRVLDLATLMVRTNPLHDGSATEIERAVDDGADILMLPMAENVLQVATFVELVKGRAKTSMLVETAAGLRSIRALVQVPGVHEIHVGLNDLRLSLHLNSLFEPLCQRLLDEPARIVRQAGLRFGFGGVTTPDTANLPVPAEQIIGEHARLGSSVAWLGRSFRGRFETWPKELLSGRGAALNQAVASIRACATFWANCSEAVLLENHALIRARVAGLT
jgi:hypothetical protein